MVTKTTTRRNKRTTGKKTEDDKGQVRPGTMPVTLTGIETLKPKEVAFIESYLRNGVGKHAALDAGISEVSAASWASRRLRDPRVMAVLHEAQRQIVKTLNVDKNWVAFKLIDIIQAGCQKRPVEDPFTKRVIYDADTGRPLYRLLDANSARAALQDLSKLLGLESQTIQTGSSGVLLVQDLPTIDDWDNEHAGE